MCEFFSFVGDGNGNYKYSDWEVRKNMLGSDNLPDSHTRILEGVAPKYHDRWSKYEYNPLTKHFKIDEPVEGHDHVAAQDWVEKLDFKQIVPALIIKPIVHPFRDRVGVVDDEALALLRKWDSVRACVRDSVWFSVGASVRACVRDSVRDSVLDSVRDSVLDSVRGSVWASVRDSVRDSLWAYTSSFFDITCEYDFLSCVALWERGLVPSFDGKIWRLHSGPDGAILWEGEV